MNPQRSRHAIEDGKERADRRPSKTGRFLRVVSRSL
jgi:hypothetical protein